MTETADAVDPSLLDRALIEESAKKSALVWVRGSDRPARALWHVWHENAVWVVGDGPGEQPLPELVDGGTVVVTARSKDKGGRLVTWPARVTEQPARDERWEAAVAELKAKRLNAPDTEEMVERWARECRVLRLEPAGEPRERPGAMPEGALAARPVETPATTRRAPQEALPRLLFRRRRRS